MYDHAIKARVVVLISGTGSNLEAIINATKEPGCPYSVVTVISNRMDAKGLEHAIFAKIPQFVVDHNQFAKREDFDQALIRIIDQYQPDIVALAGFMRILTDDFVKHYYGKLLNIHPSLLPKYRGLNTHAKALEAGDTLHGASVHFVTKELDGGPVILQTHVPIAPNDNPDKLAKRVLEKEHFSYPLVIKWFAEGRLKLTDGFAQLDDKFLTTPLILENLDTIQ